MTLLQQRERERELERERERERERDRDRSTEALRELEAKVQALVERGLVRMERSSSGRLDVQVVQDSGTLTCVAVKFTCVLQVSALKETLLFYS